jgi:thiamine-monophosphate kinase
MIDVSDGLIADLAHIAKASNVVIDIDTTRLHLDADLVQAASQLGLDATELALTGGDDHAIVATFSAEASLPAGFEVVGSVRESTPGGSVLVDGVPYQNAGGYRHF